MVDDGMIFQDACAKQGKVPFSGIQLHATLAPQKSLNHPITFSGSVTNCTKIGTDFNLFET